MCEININVVWNNWNAVCIYPQHLLPVLCFCWYDYLIHLATHGPPASGYGSCVMEIFLLQGRAQLAWFRVTGPAKVEGQHRPRLQRVGGISIGCGTVWYRNIVTLYVDMYQFVWRVTHGNSDVYVFTSIDINSILSSFAFNLWRMCLNLSCF